MKLFGIDRPIIAMLHLPPSPGVAGHPGIMGAMETMRRDLQACLSAGVDALLLENMHDFPCIGEPEMGPEICAYLTRMAVAARHFADEVAGGASRPIPIGVQVLFAANRTALAVAQAGNLQFIRAEGWTHAHVSDKGIAEAQAGRVKRYQHGIGAGKIKIFADVKKKHASHSLTADLGIGEIAGLMAMHGADGVVVTGGVTGETPSAADLAAVRNSSRLPLLLGSGLTEESLPEFFPLADAFIVGSSFKEGGDWRAPVDPKIAADFIKTVRRLREGE